MMMKLLLLITTLFLVSKAEVRQDAANSMGAEMEEETMPAANVHQNAETETMPAAKVHQNAETETMPAAKVKQDAETETMPAATVKQDAETESMPGEKETMPGFHKDSEKEMEAEKEGEVETKPKLMEEDPVEDLSKCAPPEMQLKDVHLACQASWRDLYNMQSATTGTVEKLKSQCPYFCDHVKEGCVWRIGCKRCKGLLEVCKLSVPSCDNYIKINEGKSDEERCPQYEFCKPATANMDLIRSVCEDIYTDWSQKADLGTTVAELGKLDSCSGFCIHEKEDCGWRIVCRKCGILTKILSHSSPVAKAKFKEIMAKGRGNRCTHYKGDTMPNWWVTGDWF